jgi:hypothetical protein
VNYLSMLAGLAFVGPMLPLQLAAWVKQRAGAVTQLVDRPTS